MLSLGSTYTSCSYMLATDHSSATNCSQMLHQVAILFQIVHKCYHQVALLQVVHKYLPLIDVMLQINILKCFSQSSSIHKSYSKRGSIIHSSDVSSFKERLVLCTIT